ncbi:hypothetical protein N136_00879 [Leifsonia aquatica ATCC 14665]|uniref:Uncharacterized protein n=1 Tax=Leifsonia aquatica ATCC 14665 TaxID=1358026 RepID=U2RVF2_LEIAQ|nr:hypothetical protein N136_00879 [Leifsonia aquatica ATCC 14665]
MEKRDESSPQACGSTICPRILRDPGWSAPAETQWSDPAT